MYLTHPEKKNGKRAGLEEKKKKLNILSYKKWNKYYRRNLVRSIFLIS